MTDLAMIKKCKELKLVDRDERIAKLEAKIRECEDKMVECLRKQDTRITKLEAANELRENAESTNRLPELY